MNNLKVLILMGGLTVLLVMLGNAWMGQSGALLFFIISLGMNFFSYYYSDKLVIKMTGARELSSAEAPQLHSMIRRLADRAGIPMPKVYITPSRQPNAFATGRNPQHAAVAVTAGLMQILNRDEVEGVLAHEIAHIKNRDILIGTIAASLAGAISMLANVAQWGAMFGGLGSRDDEGGGSIIGLLAMAILAPIAAMIIQMAISRSREYQADATGARLSGSSRGLANALLKLEASAQRIPMEVSPSAAHMFIVNPLRGFNLASLFSTHPATADRVKRLNAMQV